MKSVENAAGIMVIDPQHVAAWGGITVAGNIVGAAYAPLLVETIPLAWIPLLTG